MTELTSEYDPRKNPLPEGYLRRPDTIAKCYQCYLSDPFTNHMTIVTCDPLGETYKPVPNSSLHFVPSWVPTWFDPFWLRSQMSLGVEAKYYDNPDDLKKETIRKSYWKW